MKNSYTMVILTFNRPLLVRRLLDCLVSSNVMFRILLLDHGDEQSRDHNRRLVEQSALNMEHVSYSDDVDLREVLCDGLQRVDTEYASIFPDDDIPNIPGVEASVRYLASHPDYVAAQGYILGFTEDDSGISLHSVQDFVPSFIADDSLSRLLQLSRRFQPIFYAVYRADALKWSHSRLARLEIPNIMFQELYHASIVVFRGNVARIPEIFMLRRITGSHVDRRHIHPVHQMIESPVKLADDYICYRSQLLDTLYDDGFCDESAMGRNEAGRIIDLIHALYVERHFDGSFVESELHKILMEPGRSYFDNTPPENHNLETDPIMFMEIGGGHDNNAFRISIHNTILDIARTESSPASLNGEIRLTEPQITELVSHVRGYGTR